MTYKMNPEIKAQWVAALRSGTYPQGQSVLRSLDGRYCCLGVLCDLVDPHGWTTSDFSYRHRQRCNLPDETIYKLVEYSTSSEFIALAAMNDNGHSFAEIADYIEANL